MFITFLRSLIFILIVSLSLESHTYYSEYQQDKIIHETYFPGKKKGVFVDIGAYDGITFNNTAFFEKELGWTGLCIEPIPEAFVELKKNRVCKSISGCISNSNKSALFFRAAAPSMRTEMLSTLAKTSDPTGYNKLIYEVGRTGGQLQVQTINCSLLNELLQNNNIYHLNLLSLDTSGGEFEILASIDYTKFTIDVICVDDKWDDPRIIPFLEQKGYQLDRQSGQDLFFINTSFSPKRDNE